MRCRSSLAAACVEPAGPWLEAGLVKRPPGLPDLSVFGPKQTPPPPPPLLVLCPPPPPWPPPGLSRSPSDPRPRDVDRELLLLLTTTDEGASSNFMVRVCARVLWWGWGGGVGGGEKAGVCPGGMCDRCVATAVCIPLVGTWGCVAVLLACNPRAQRTTFWCCTCHCHPPKGQP